MRTTALAMIACLFPAATLAEDYDIRDRHGNEEKNVDVVGDKYDCTVTTKDYYGRVTSYYNHAWDTRPPAPDDPNTVKIATVPGEERTEFASVPGEERTEFANEQRTECGPPKGPFDSDRDGVYDDTDQCPNTPLGDKVDEVGCTIVEDLTIDLVNDEFDFDSAELKPDMMTALGALAERVKASPGDEHLMIIGHTDSMGSDEYNMGLSQRRADSARNYLIEQGLAADRLATAGRGESEPVADNATAEGRKKNRRVEIKTN